MPLQENIADLCEHRAQQHTRQNRQPLHALLTQPDIHQHRAEHSAAPHQQQISRVHSSASPPVHADAK